MVQTEPGGLKRVWDKNVTGEAKVTEMEMLEKK